MIDLKHLVGGNVVGSGSNFIVIQKAKRRFLIEIESFKIQELKNATTPYGSQFWDQSTFIVSKSTNLSWKVKSNIVKS